jgi:hypothetical protein
MDGKQKDSYQTMLFFDDGLSMRQKYRLIDDIDGVNSYKLGLKATITNQELEKYQEVESKSDFKKLSKYIKEDQEFKWFTIETPTNYDESDVYRYINDETSRLEYIEGNLDFVGDHYELLSDKQKAVYNYLYQKDKEKNTNKAESYRRLLTPYLRNEFADNTVNNSNNFEKGLLGQMVELDRIATGLKHWSGIGNQVNIDSFGEQIPTDIAMMDPKIDSSLTGGWHTFYNVNKLVGSSIPGVAIGALTVGSGTVAEVVGAGGVAAIYGGSAYGNSIGYAEQNGYSDSQAKAFATKTGINEGCKTLLFYGLLKGTGAASSAGYMSAGESAAVSAAGGFGIEFLDETSVKPNIQESTLGEDVDVDYKRALENAAVAGLITGAAAYVYSKSNAESVSGEQQNIYENAHVLDKLDGFEQLKNEVVAGSRKVEIDYNSCVNTETTIDYSYKFDRELINFNDDYEIITTVDKDLILVQYSSDAPDASLSYWTTIDEANGITTIEEYMDKLALSKEWGNRDVVKVARIPAGTKVKYAVGTAREQLLLEDPRPGGGVQYLFNKFDTDWITEIRGFQIKGD